MVVSVCVCLCVGVFVYACLCVVCALSIALAAAPTVCGRRWQTRLCGAGYWRLQRRARARGGQMGEVLLSEEVMPVIARESHEATAAPAVTQLAVLNDRQHMESHPPLCARPHSNANTNPNQARRA